MEPEKKSNGALVGIVIIIIILVAGGIYIWQSGKNKTIDGDGFAEIETEESITATENDFTELDSLQKEIDMTDIDIDTDIINSVQ